MAIALLVTFEVPSDVMGEVRQFNSNMMTFVTEKSAENALEQIKATHADCRVFVRGVILKDVII